MLVADGMCSCDEDGNLGRSVDETGCKRCAKRCVKRVDGWMMIIDDDEWEWRGDGGGGGRQCAK